MISTMDNLTTTNKATTVRPEVVTEIGSMDGITETERIVIIVMLSVLVVIGTFGNALAIYVFVNLKQKVTSTIFILTLAGTDFVTCLITIPFTITMEYLKYFVAVDLVCKVYHFLITTTVPFSCVVIVAIAVDRYMCICHPFHHWMTIPRARIIIGTLAFVIFIFGGIVCMHYTIFVTVHEHVNTTAAPGMAYFSLRTTAGVTTEWDGMSTNSTDYSYTAFPVSGGPSYTQNLNWTVEDRTTQLLTSAQNLTTRKITGTVSSLCNLNPHFINRRFFDVFRRLYSGIFLVSCIIVLVLYSLIYRSVIAQRRKKLRIKSAQCCLLWNAASIDTSHEAAEMTQDIELSQVNGEDRYTPRLNSGVTEDTETQNNGLVRKCSLSKARIERMRVANIKTAFTLFIVTLVFIFAFLPSWLMALDIIEMNVVIFYMHYVYNVVNPLIYAFLNQNFKIELRRIFQCESQ